MKKVCVLTSTRAEYGLLYWLIKEIEESDAFELQLVVTGTHLSYEHGYTIKDILADGFQPAIEISNLISDDSSLSLTYSSSILMQRLAVFFDQEAPDCFVVLGDRVELLAACNVALMAKIPVVHVHGGEVTEGAMDEKVRHAVSKLANLHFTSTETYRQRVIQMGEAPETVVNCGALGLESITKESIPQLEELSATFNADLQSGYFLIVYHPETNKSKEDITELLDALDDYPQYKKVIIYPNSDLMSRDIICKIESYKEKHAENVTLVKSALRNDYLGLMKHCTLYIGNSSSGIIEMPSFQRPVINIGDRQKGRICSEVTIGCELDSKDLELALGKALSESFQKKVANAQNPYQGDSPSKQIVKKLKSALPELSVQKKFMDITFKV